MQVQTFADKGVENLKGCSRAVFGETACGSLWKGDGLLSIGTGGCFAAVADVRRRALNDRCRSDIGHSDLQVRAKPV